MGHTRFFPFFVPSFDHLPSFLCLPTEDEEPRGSARMDSEHLTRTHSSSSSPADISQLIAHSLPTLLPNYYCPTHQHSPTYVRSYILALLPTIVITLMWPAPSLFHLSVFHLPQISMWLYPAPNRTHKVVHIVPILSSLLSSPTPFTTPHLSSPNCSYPRALYMIL